MPKGRVTTPVDAATKAVLAAGQEEFAALCARIEPRFRRPEVRQRMRRHLAGLLAPLPRKNAWQLAEHSGEAVPDGIQRLMNAAQWDADAVRDDLRRYVIDHLGEAPAVLVVDETGFLKKGTKSVGVQRQYSGTAGRVENCQIGVFLAYASSRGRAFLDRELYLPREWAEDAERRKEAGVPEEVEFATKPELARRMLERARKAGVPATWVTGDAVYGNDRRLRQWLEAERQPFVLGIPANQYLAVSGRIGPVPVAAAELVANVAADAWECHSAGAGAKGPRWYDWALVPLHPHRGPAWFHGLLARRSRSDPNEIAYYVVLAPAGTPLSTLVQVAGTRWAVEESLESAKGEVGLDQYEVRHWHAWYRYITLALLAHAYLTVLRARAVGGDEKGGHRSVSCPGDGTGGGVAAAHRARSAAITV